MRGRPFRAVDRTLIPIFTPMVMGRHTKAGHLDGLTDGMTVVGIVRDDDPARVIVMVGDEYRTLTHIVSPMVATRSTKGRRPDGGRDDRGR